MSGIHKGAWAIEARAKMNNDSRDSVDAICAALKISKEKAQEVFNSLAEKHQWKRWEALAIKDVALDLHKHGWQ